MLRYKNSVSDTNYYNVIIINICITYVNVRTDIHM